MPRGFNECKDCAAGSVAPSAGSANCSVCASGKHAVNAKTFLEKRYNEDIEIEDAIHTAILTLKVTPPTPPMLSRCEPRLSLAPSLRQEGFEGQMTEDNIELAVIGEDRKLKILTPAEIRDYLAEVE